MTPENAQPETLVDYIRQRAKEQYGVTSDRAIGQVIGLSKSTAAALLGGGRPPRRETIKTIADTTEWPEARMLALANLQKDHPLRPWVPPAEAHELTEHQRTHLAGWILMMARLNREVEEARAALAEHRSGSS